MALAPREWFNEVRNIRVQGGSVGPHYEPH